MKVDFRWGVTLFLITLGACAAPSSPPGNGEYEQAIAAAAIIDASGAAPPLTPLKAGRVRLVSWRKPIGDALAPGSFHLSRSLWATVDGEIQEFCRRYVARTHPDHSLLQRRIEKVLGLHPGDGDGREMVQYSVSVADVFRPCIDPAVDTIACPRVLDEREIKGHIQKDPVVANFLLEQMLASYVRGTGYPFTRLGFTYDWDSEASSRGHFGLSEYVTRPDITVEILSVTAKIDDYCAPQ